jgi:muramoyltetrapeptide carboxypeptidase
MVKPPRLSPGDTVGIVAPASVPANPDLIESSAEAVKRLGFKPFLGRNVHQRLGYLAGTDEERAKDLMDMFARGRVRAIFCLRGGYGSSRILPLLDFEFIRHHPKIVAGYSDITSLHCALLRRSGLVSMHGPMLGPEFTKEDLPRFTADSFTRTLTQATAAGGICRGHSQTRTTTIYPGCASGRLVGGNLTLLCATIGTTYQPSFSRRILFLEEIDETPYRIDRMLTQLLHAGLLQQVAGIAIGFMKGCKDPKAKNSSEYRQTVEDTIRDRLTTLKIPILLGLPFGHDRYNATLPYGVRATLDTSIPDLLITETAVS